MSNYIERYWRDATPEDAIKEPPMVASGGREKGFGWKVAKAGNVFWIANVSGSLQK